MLLNVLTSAALIANAVAAPRTLSACSETSEQPCKCPEGTDYMTATTYITLGANAFDVRELVGDCKITLFTISLFQSLSVADNMKFSLQFGLGTTESSRPHWPR